VYLYIFSPMAKSGTLTALVLISLVSLCIASSSNIILCNTATNYGPANRIVYNTACPTARPYCTGSGQCSECAAVRDPACDCPANYKCVSWQYNSVRPADFCIPTPLAIIGKPCVDSNGCNISMTTVTTSAYLPATYGVCMNSACAYCNGGQSPVFICTQGVPPGGADESRYGSKAEGRSCSAARNAWNTNSLPLNPPLPVDPFQYERQQYTDATPSPTMPASGGTTPSQTMAAAGVTPSGTPSRTGTATASLSQGASPSVSPSVGANVMTSGATVTMVDLLVILFVFPLAVIALGIEILRS